MLNDNNLWTPETPQRQQASQDGITLGQMQKKQDNSGKMRLIYIRKICSSVVICNIINIHIPIYTQTNIIPPKKSIFILVFYLLVFSWTEKNIFLTYLVIYLDSKVFYLDLLYIQGPIILLGMCGPN